MPAAQSAAYGRRSATFEKLKADLKAQRRKCGLCGQPIDYTVEYPHPDSFTVEHLQSRTAHPELAEDPANLIAAHARCNWAKGKGEPPSSLGLLSEEW